MARELSRQGPRTPLLPADDTNSLTSFPDPSDSVSSPSPPPPGGDPLNGLLECNGPSMFDEPDRHDAHLGPPGTLASAPDDVIERIIQHRGAVDLIRRLSALLAERDAHVTALTRLAEEYNVPAAQIARAATREAQIESQRLLALAAASEDDDGQASVPSLTAPVERSSSPVTSDAASTQNYATVRGLTRLFGGNGKRRESRQSTESGANSVKSTTSSRSTSRVATVRGRPVSLDVRSIGSNESSNWATALFGVGGGGGSASNGGGTTKANSTVRHRPARLQREPVEMSTRHDHDQLPPTLQKTPAYDPHEAEWNKFILRLAKSREQAGEEARSGELIGASRFGTEGNAGKQKLEHLTRLVIGGIPMHLRHPLWMELSGATATVEPDGYQYFLSLPADADAADPAVAAAELDAILKDVPRTLTQTSDFYAARGSDRLQRVLLAFVRRHPGLGYTQGLNMIAGYLLLAIPDESDAFWLLSHMVSTFFPPDYFARKAGLLAPLADNVVLRGYVRELLPRLGSHLDNNLNLAPEHTAPLSWFMTGFAAVLPASALLRVWDVWLGLPGHQAFLLAVALSLLATHARQLCACESSSEYFAYMAAHCRVADDEHPAKVTELVRQAVALRRKLEGVEVRRALAMTKFKRNSSTEALYTPDEEGQTELGAAAAGPSTSPPPSAAAEAGSDDVQQREE